MMAHRCCQQCRHVSPDLVSPPLRSHRGACPEIAGDHPAARQTLNQPQIYTQQAAQTRDQMGVPAAAPGFFCSLAYAFLHRCG